METVEGTVTRIDGQSSWVDAASAGRFRCDLRGKIARKLDMRLAVGDRVALEPRAEPEAARETAFREGVIVGVLPRRTELRRPRSEKRDQVLCANVDLVGVVLAAFDPPYKRNFLDRVLVEVEREGLEPLIVFNKMDLADEAYRAVVEDDARVYVKLGYRCCATSVVTGEGISDLLAMMQGKITVFTGHSGVGKSTLLNAINPALRILTGEVSDVTGRGKHTTSWAELHPLERGGYVADTPGIRSFGLGDVPSGELPGLFRDIARATGRCRFNDCSHREEPGCTVLEAVSSGEIDEERYESYRKLRDELESTEGGKHTLRKR
ncbi:ribosome small subunit-dependent GTPase A [bacterium]|nr:ribosome small subunit-dependent GTPase A [bacterium]